MSRKSVLHRFLAWRVKHVSQKQFVLILSVLVGISSGLVAVVIKNSVQFMKNWQTSEAVGGLHDYLYFAFPLVGILITITIIRYIIKQKVYPGIPTTLYAISKRKGLMKRHNMFSSLITSVFTVGFGGSAGLEAPTVATSAAIGSNLGHSMRMNHKTKTLLIGCAAAGSMAAIFKAPVAAIVFAIEVIMLDLTMSSMVPLLLASISAVLTSTLFLGEDVLQHFDLREFFGNKTEPLYGMKEVPFYVLLGVFTGFVSLFFTKVHNFTSGLLDRVQTLYKKAIIGGLLIGGILFLFPALYGEGYGVINAFISGETSTVNQTVFDSGVMGWFDSSNLFLVLIFLLLLTLFKAVSTTITLNIGGIGGIFAPTLFMGSAVGYFFARVMNYFNIIHLSERHFTLVGMAGLMAGILHAPLTAIFLIAEITGGYELFVPLMITSAISYTTIRVFSQHSIYTMQLAQRGELITHHKDQAVLTLMNLEQEIETDLRTVTPELTLRDLVVIVAMSKRNIFPVIDDEDALLGLVLLDDIREIMFDSSVYDTTKVYDLMVAPPETIDSNENMDAVMQKFDKTGAWNLPVVKEGKYVGFVSKSKLFSAYRKLLKEFSDH
jgi:CIC family chloride channel protein